MQGILTSIQNIFRFHKLKILATLVFAVLFAILIFPYSDLADLMTVKVAEATNNQVYIQADNLKFSLLPGPGAKLENVVVETPNMPSIQAGSIAIAPSVLSLISMEPNFSARAEDIFKGNVDLSVATSGKTRAGNPKQQIQVLAEQVALNSLSEFLRGMNLGDLKLQGSLNLSSGMVVDATFEDQPNGTVNLNISKFSAPSRSLQTALGPVQLPNLSLQQVQGKAVIKEGRLSFDQLQLGSSSDELNGTISGDIGMTVTRGPDGNIFPIFGSYNLQIALNVSSSFQQRASLFLLLVDGFKRPTPTGYAYNFKASGRNFEEPAKITQ